MSEFDFNLDFEAELAGIRGPKEKSHKPQKQQPKAQPQKPKKQPEQRRPEQRKPEPVKPVTQAPPEVPHPKHGQGASSKGAESAPQTPSHSHGGEDVSSPAPTTVEKKSATAPVDWKRFKTLSGMFEHVGGDRPVRLNPNIKKARVAGMPEPMILAVQKRLKEKHTGAVVAFPWGEYEITENNRVFTTKASLMRYLLFDALRDENGTHIQYAKQWMVLQHPVFDKGFNPETHLGPASDELDIYTLLFVAHTAEEYREEQSGTSGSEQDYQTAERLGMLNMSMGRVLDKLNEQEQLINEHMERNQMTQTVLLLDRMGLLKGGLPRDVGEFVRVLEENRDSLSETGQIVDHHIDAEKARQKTLARQERMRRMQARA